MALGLVLDLSFAGFVATVNREDEAVAQSWRPPGVRFDDVDDWVEECLIRSGGSYSDLGWIAVGVGPGSFTGIRIAMAFAQGLAVARNLPLHGFTTFAALLLSYAGETGEEPLAVIPANSGRFYVAKHPDIPGRMVEAEELASLIRSETVGVIPADVPAMDSILPKFQRVHAIEERWDVPGLVRHAKSAGLDPLRPCYLQVSAAEEKSGHGRA